MTGRSIKLLPLDEVGKQNGAVAREIKLRGWNSRAKGGVMLGGMAVGTSMKGLTVKNHSSDEERVALPSHLVS